MIKQILCASALSLTAAAVHAQQLHYPTPPTDNTIDEYFGVKVSDPYRPLENDTSAATAAWDKAEDAVNNAYLAKMPQRAKSRKRLRRVVD